MRIVIDMQGAQTGSRFRGIGRYTLSLAKAIVRNHGDHEIILALNGLFPETIELICADFNSLLPQENIRVWHALGPTKEVDPANHWRREVAERMREAFLASLCPDVVLITSLFEGFGDDAVGSIGILDNNVRTAVILYDLIPLISPDEHFRSSKIHQDWYYRKIASLKRSQKLLAISESARQEALGVLDFEEDEVANISGACDESFRVLNLSDREKKEVWDKLGISKPFVMYTGGADATKNLHRLIMAYAQLPIKVRQGYQLVFAGKIPEGNIQDLLQTAKKNRLSDDEVLFTGYIEDNDLIGLYNSCALFVFPSLHEGFGMPPLEAMACGAPVIAANVTSLPEVIGLSDALFDPNSVAAISDKIKQALTDETFRARLLAHGRTHFRTFSWDESAKRALNALQDFGRGNAAHVSTLLSIEKTSIFKRRHLKILAIKLDHMGDFILAIPALAKLKARYPYASIDIIVGSWNAPIAQELNLFDNVYSYDFFKSKSSEPPSITSDIQEALLKKLRKYDIAIDLRRQSDSRFLLTKTRADLKVGYETFDAEIDNKLDITIRAYPDVPFKTTPLNITPIASQMVRLVDAIPSDINDFIFFPDLGKKEDPEQGAIAIFPKAGNDAREWNKSNFIALVDLLVGDPNVRIINVYFANHNEASEFGFKSDGKLHVNIGLDFSGLTRSLSGNSVCVSNNSGGAHLASYLGLTVIGLYSGHELPSEWAPQFNDSYVIHRAAECAPCHGAKRSDCPNAVFCLSEISVADVYAKTTEAVSGKKRLIGKNERQFTQSIPLQKNPSTIVKELISSIAPLIPSEVGVSLVNIAAAISINHPTYSVSPDLTSIYPGVVIDYKSNYIEWKGFSGIEPQFRWTDGDTAAMQFDCPETMPACGTLTLLIDTLGEQRIIARLNGKKIFDEVKDGRHIELSMQAQNFQVGHNKLELELPDSRMPDDGDSRKLAIAMRSFRIDA
jgi:glycosyltransferase involved in cell wall biosynthesis/ADP-heptose:LPS heptosyltransferase